MTVLVRAALLLAVMALAGCAGSPGSASADRSVPTAMPTPPSTLPAFESAQRERAREREREQRWPDARQAWAAVLALRPDDAEAQAGWSQADRSARTTAQDRARRAEQARARGDTEAAMRLHLEALAHDPTLPGPADALRALEFERALRAPPQSFARAPAPQANPELEHAELLVAEGEIDAALAVLEPMARAPRADAALKRRVCDLLLGVADTQAPRSAALATVQRCLKLLPQHAPALQRARRAS